MGNQASFSNRAEAVLFQEVKRYERELIAESATCAKRDAVDVVSASHVDHAIRNLRRQAAKMKVDLPSSLGILLLGSGVGSTMAAVGQWAFIAGIASAIAGLALLAYHIAKR